MANGHTRHTMFNIIILKFLNIKWSHALYDI